MLYPIGTKIKNEKSGHIWTLIEYYTGDRIYEFEFDCGHEYDTIKFSEDQLTNLIEVTNFVVDEIPYTNIYGNVIETKDCF